MPPEIKGSVYLDGHACGQLETQGHGGLGEGFLRGNHGFKGCGYQDWGWNWQQSGPWRLDSGRGERWWRGRLALKAFRQGLEALQVLDGFLEGSRRGGLRNRVVCCGTRADHGFGWARHRRFQPHGGEEDGVFIVQGRVASWFEGWFGRRPRGRRGCLRTELLFQFCQILLPGHESSLSCPGYAIAPSAQSPPLQSHTCPRQNTADRDGLQPFPDRRHPRIDAPWRNLAYPSLVSLIIQPGGPMRRAASLLVLPLILASGSALRAQSPHYGFNLNLTVPTGAFNSTTYPAYSSPFSQSGPLNVPQRETYEIGR